MGGQVLRQIISDIYPDADCFEVMSAAQIAWEKDRSGGAGWWPFKRRRSRVVQGSQPPEGQAQMVWANMLLHQVSDPEGLIGQWKRALAHEGFLMFSCFGPDTLVELRQLYERHGWPPPVEGFTDMHDWGDLMIGAGFADPVMGMEHITLTFSSAEAALAELRLLGRNLHPQRFAGLRGRAWRAELLAAMERDLRPGPGEPISLTFEIVYCHALRPTPHPVRGAIPAFNFSELS